MKENSMSYPSGIALRDLHVGAYNPRTFVPSDQGWIDFKNSILAHNGIYTPIVVRPVEGKKTPWEIVAGQRRYLGALETLGQDYVIPTNVKVLTDEEAKAMALSENIDRAAMNPAEEAMAAARMLAEHKGDKAATAKRMGWSLKTLEDRLKLMACSDKVREQLIYQKISLGIAELLSGMTFKDQDEMLERFEKSGIPTIEEAKTLLLSRTKSLTIAIFDKAGCAGCDHNSAKQKSMFENIEEGHCLNPKCYDEKTEGRLAQTVEELKGDFNRIEIVRPGMDLTMIRIEVAKLGDVQVTACRSCANFGAAVSAKPNTLGKVVEKLCFDTECNTKLTNDFKAQQDALKAAEEAQKATPKAPVTESTGSEQTTGAAMAPPATRNVGSGKAEGNPDPNAPTQVTLTNAVYEFRDKLYQRVLAIEYANNPEFQAKFVLALILNNQGSNFDGHLLKEKLTKDAKIKDGRMSVGLEASMKSALAMERTDVEALLPRLGLVAIHKLTREELAALTKLSKAELAKHFQLDTDFGREFLKCLTKDQIASVCEELGIKAAMDKTFASIANGKKDDFIKQVTSVKDFSYEGKVPKVLNPSFGK
jgi:PRTRC genetic system ParB family protein